jgi:cysteinyl-tRNA synthetase
MRLFNTFGRKLEHFRPVKRGRVTVFTCGPSVYQRSHVGNFRTFLFEDVLVRYLEFAGYTVVRGMNITDVEDKALAEARRIGTDIRTLTDGNIRKFLQEMKLLKMKIPDFLPRASECIDEIASLIGQLLDRGVAYRHQGNIYFDPLKFAAFGKLYGLDMKEWPKKKRRFHKDTYAGMHWNLGDFILWHGRTKRDDVWWDTIIGTGRPSWNIQDPGMVSKYFNETLSIYCGGIDNLYRHHDYSLAILESVRPFPMARYWMHCSHLLVDGEKMSKSRGNILYTGDMITNGLTPREIRFFLIYGHYRERLDYSPTDLAKAVVLLGDVRKAVTQISRQAGHSADPAAARRVKSLFSGKMDADLNVREAVDDVYNFLTAKSSGRTTRAEAAGIMQGLREIDEVLRVIF